MFRSFTCHGSHAFIDTNPNAHDDTKKLKCGKLQIFKLQFVCKLEINKASKFNETV